MSTIEQPTFKPLDPKSMNSSDVDKDKQDEKTNIKANHQPPGGAPFGLSSSASSSSSSSSPAPPVGTASIPSFAAPSTSENKDVKDEDKDLKAPELVNWDAYAEELEVREAEEKERAAKGDKLNEASLQELRDKIRLKCRASAAKRGGIGKLSQFMESNPTDASGFSSIFGKDFSFDKIIQYITNSTSKDRKHMRKRIEDMDKPMLLKVWDYLAENRGQIDFRTLPKELLSGLEDNFPAEMREKIKKFLKMRKEKKESAPAEKKEDNLKKDSSASSSSSSAAAPTPSDLKESSSAEIEKEKIAKTENDKPLSRIEKKRKRQKQNKQKLTSVSQSLGTPKGSS